MNPIGLALGAANPGLMPLAFTGGGGGYPSRTGGCGLFLAVVLVLAALAVALWFNWPLTLAILGGTLLIVSALGSAYGLSFAVSDATDSLFLAILTLFGVLGVWAAAVIAVVRAFA